METKIHRPYALVTHIPVWEGDDQSLWLDASWEKDLLLHLEYIEDFTLVACVRRIRSQDNTLRKIALRPGFGLVRLPDHGSVLRALVAFVPTLTRLRAAVDKAEIVHFGILGWPLPVGWIAGLLALQRRRKTILYIENAEWRADGRCNPLAVLRRFVFERMASYFAERVDLFLASHQGYVDSFVGAGQRGVSHVLPASWIDESFLVPLDKIRRDPAAAAATHDRPLRVLFAGRLIAEKGVQILLDAARLLSERGADVRIDIMGDGKLSAAVDDAIREAPQSNLSRVPSVAYGRAFLDQLLRYDLVVVPSLGDEQPRIVFDAFSQGVPVLASRTAGLEACVEHGQTGILVAPGSARDLAAALEQLCDRTIIESMRERCLDTARRHTHHALHQVRSRIISDRFFPSPDRPVTTA